MFLNHDNIENTFIKEGFGDHGERESVLVVMLNKEPDELKSEHPKDYQDLSNKLGYLDNLAHNGFLDFDRIEVVSTQTRH